MNIFFPYDDIKASVEVLDDARLRKQIVECYTIYKAIASWRSGKVQLGYLRHPITQYYKDYPRIVCEYGMRACEEFLYRFRKPHQMEKFFISHLGAESSEGFKPFYAEGSKDSPDCIRTTENTAQLFQRKLCKKWNSGKHLGQPPKWTNRGKPRFYRES